MNYIISTGFEKLDKYLNGAEKSSLIYIAAKHGMGMRTFAKEFNENMEFSEIKGNYPIHYFFGLHKENEMSISEIRQKSKELNPDCIFVDYFQLIASNIKRENKNQELSEISHQFRSMAKDLDATVICTIQITDYKNKPMLSDLQKIGSIDYDADVIMFLHRDDFTSNNMDDIDPDITELIIAKNNYGDTGTIELKYDSKTKNFYEV